MKENRSTLLSSHINAERLSSELLVPKKCVEQGHKSTKKLRSSDSNVLPSSIRRGQSSRKCQVLPKVSPVKPVLLLGATERSGLQEKVVLKQNASLRSPSKSGFETKESEQDSLSKMTNIDDEMNKLEKCYAAADTADTTGSSLTKLQTCSEKVSKWLEESEDSPWMPRSATDKNIDFGGERSGQVAVGGPSGLDNRSTCVVEKVDKIDEVDLVSDCRNAGEVVGNLAECVDTEAKKVVGRASDECPRSKALGLRSLLLLSITATVAFSVYFMVLLSEMKTLPWGMHEPPPT